MHWLFIEMKRHLDPIAVNSLFLRMIIIFIFTCLIYRYEPTRKICSDCDVTRYHWRSYALTIAVGFFLSYIFTLTMLQIRIMKFVVLLYNQFISQSCYVWGFRNEDIHVLIRTRIKTGPFICSVTLFCSRGNTIGV